MAIQDFSGDLSPSMSDVTRDVVPIIPPSFHDEAFLPQISLPASISYRSSLKKRKLSTARVEKSRSVCTSRQRAATMSDSEADKKRNKLGYQRISIACAHCRRRKIRCLLAEKDSQGRCQNCIRLKKECVFYPIDQQGAYESRSEESSRHGFGSTPSSGFSSTSPDLQSQSHGAGRQPFATVPSNTTQTFQGMPVDQSAMFQGNYYHLDRSYQDTYEHSSWPPLSRGYEMHTPARTLSPSRSQSQQPFWSHDQSSATGDFAPFPGESAQQVRTPTSMFTTALPHSSPEQQWQLQQPPQSSRSMTYPGPAVTLSSNMPHYAPPFSSEMSQPMPIAAYQASPMDPESTPIMRGQMQGPPFSTPLPQSHVFPQHQSDPYGYRSPQTHSSPGEMPVQQAYPVHWNPSTNALGFQVDEHQGGPTGPPPHYVVPSQRPR